ncbi:hypothetical protein Bbelb_094560 [Branchiostoma belcheri]|nr:hypothetical protein Bbelb_094560 [Branchiostoma belcheri]
MPAGRRVTSFADPRTPQPISDEPDLAAANQQQARERRSQSQTDPCLLGLNLPGKKGDLIEQPVRTKRLKLGRERPTKTSSSPNKRTPVKMRVFVSACFLSFVLLSVEGAALQPTEAPPHNGTEAPASASEVQPATEAPQPVQEATTKTSMLAVVPDSIMAMYDKFDRFSQDFDQAKNKEALREMFQNSDLNRDGQLSYFELLHSPYVLSPRLCGPGQAGDEEEDDEDDDATAVDHIRCDHEILLRCGNVLMDHINRTDQASICEAFRVHANCIRDNVLSAANASVRCDMEAVREYQTALMEIVIFYESLGICSAEFEQQLDKEALSEEMEAAELIDVVGDIMREQREEMRGEEEEEMEEEEEQRAMAIQMIEEQIAALEERWAELQGLLERARNASAGELPGNLTAEDVEQEMSDIEEQEDELRRTEDEIATGGEEFDDDELDGLPMVPEGQGYTQEEIQEALAVLEQRREVLETRLEQLLNASASVPENRTQEFEEEVERAEQELSDVVQEEDRLLGGGEPDEDTEEEMRMQQTEEEIAALEQMRAELERKLEQLLNASADELPENGTDAFRQAVEEAEQELAAIIEREDELLREQGASTGEEEGEGGMDRQTLQEAWNSLEERRERLESHLERLLDSLSDVAESDTEEYERELEETEQQLEEVMQEEEELLEGEGEGEPDDDDERGMQLRMLDEQIQALEEKREELERELEELFNTNATLDNSTMEAEEELEAELQEVVEEENQLMQEEEEILQEEDEEDDDEDGEFSEEEEAFSDEEEEEENSREQWIRDQLEALEQEREQLEAQREELLNGPAGNRTEEMVNELERQIEEVEEEEDRLVGGADGDVDDEEDELDQMGQEMDHLEEEQEELTNEINQLLEEADGAPENATEEIMREVEQLEEMRGEIAQEEDQLMEQMEEVEHQREEEAGVQMGWTKRTMMKVDFYDLFNPQKKSGGDSVTPIQPAAGELDEKEAELEREREELKEVERELVHELEEIAERDGTDGEGEEDDEEECPMEILRPCVAEFVTSVGSGTRWCDALDAHLVCLQEAVRNCTITPNIEAYHVGFLGMTTAYVRSDLCPESTFDNVEDDPIFDQIMEEDEEEDDDSSEESYEEVDTLGFDTRDESFEDDLEESYEEDSIESDVSPEDDFDDAGIMDDEEEEELSSEEEDSSEEDYPLGGAVTDDWLWNDQYTTPLPTGVPYGDDYGMEGDYDVEDMLEEEEEEIEQEEEEEEEEIEEEIEEEEIEEEIEEEEALEAAGEDLQDALEDLEDAIRGGKTEPPEPVHRNWARNRQSTNGAAVPKGTAFLTLIMALLLCLM